MLRRVGTAFCLIALSAVCAMAALGARTQEVHANRAEQHQGPVIVAQYLGSCGGSVKDKNGIETRCPSTHRPECDRSGSCWCTRDKQCGG